MTTDIQQNPSPKLPSLGLQAIISAAIVLTAFGVHQFLNWREYDNLPTPVTSNRAFRLSVEDRQLARTAWRYFEANRLPTGLVSSAADFPAITMWHMGSQLAGMTAARELGLLSPQEFDRWMQQALTSLAQLPLYREELPNKAYNAATLKPINYGELEKTQEVGFSAIDLGRLATWLDIVATRYPQHSAAARAVTSRWKLKRLVKDGYLMKADTLSGKEIWSQEGRLGYEQYAAYGLNKLKLNAAKALDFQAQTKFVDVMGVAVPVDKRTIDHNYVTSEPYILDGLENGFKALPADFAARVLQAQQRRYQQTNLMTAWSDNSIDRDPWFVYNCIFVDGQTWKTIDSAGNDAAAFRGSSLKAATGWYVLFRNIYTERVYKGMRWLGDPERGAFVGFYEQTQQPNRALTINNNSVILEALLYTHVGRPLEE